MIQGSNQPRTARRATGQDTVGLVGASRLIFFPGSRHFSGNLSVIAHRSPKRHVRRWLRGRKPVAGVIPTEGEGAADQLPMPSDGSVTPDLILRPPQGMLDVLVLSLIHISEPTRLGMISY